MNGEPHTAAGCCPMRLSYTSSSIQLATDKGMLAYRRSRSDAISRTRVSYNTFKETMSDGNGKGCDGTMKKADAPKRTDIRRMTVTEAPLGRRVYRWRRDGSARLPCAASAVHALERRRLGRTALISAARKHKKRERSAFTFRPSSAIAEANRRLQIGYGKRAASLP
jgi:hypothetical protein